MKNTELITPANTNKNGWVKEFENEVKNYLSMTTDYTKCYKFDNDKFKVDANDDYVEITFHGNRITFDHTGTVNASYVDHESDEVKIAIFNDIMASRDEIWLMYYGARDAVVTAKQNDKEQMKIYKVIAHVPGYDVEINEIGKTHFSEFLNALKAKVNLEYISNDIDIYVRNSDETEYRKVTLLTLPKSMWN